jgi:hypothetical protein
VQAQKEIPSDFASCKDKFLVQVKGLEAGEVRQQHGSLPKMVADVCRIVQVLPLVDSRGCLHAICESC